MWTWNHYYVGYSPEFKCDFNTVFFHDDQIIYIKRSNSSDFNKTTSLSGWEFSQIKSDSPEL